MHLKFLNVNDAFRGLVGLFDEASRDQVDGSASEIEVIKTSSRNGPVLQVLEPTTITYLHPLQRVLFNTSRDANPFMHVYESLWMLAGRNDIAPLAYYAANMANYSDNGVTQNGAYGYRWRQSTVRDYQEFERKFGNDRKKMASWPKKVDQLKVIIEHLKRKPESRRAVLHMSNVEDDLLKMDTTKDQCCNLCCCFSIRDTSGGLRYTHAEFIPEEKRGHPVNPTVLDMTVFNRSNDLVWGMLGANVVHFSFLQEYMAAQIGIGAGVYNQVSNNLHCYLENNSGFKPQEWLEEYKTPEYDETYPKTFPLVRDPATFDRELPDFVGAFNGEEEPWNCVPRYEEPFFQNVAGPLLTAFRNHKFREYDDALICIEHVQAEDWRIAGRNWIEKRRKNWEAKNAASPE